MANEIQRLIVKLQDHSILKTILNAFPIMSLSFQNEIFIPGINEISILSIKNKKKTTFVRTLPMPL